METENEGRLSRWSKRKLAVAEEEAKAAAESVQETEITETELQEKAAELEANCKAAEAVDLETLDKDSDISVFLKEGVPALLKKKAMMTLWRSNPVFANVDGLCDYDDDFGSPDLNMKIFKSAYTAGKGYLDLFKEDEDALVPNEEAGTQDDQVHSQAEPEGDATSVSTLEEEPDPTDFDSTDFDPADSDPTDYQSAELTVPLNDSAAIESEPVPLLSPEPETPKVSLRRRFELG